MNGWDVFWMVLMISTLERGSKSYVKFLISYNDFFYIHLVNFSYFNIGSLNHGFFLATYFQVFNIYPHILPLHPDTPPQPPTNPTQYLNGEYIRDIQYVLIWNERKGRNILSLYYIKRKKYTDLNYEIYRMCIIL